MSRRSRRGAAPGSSSASTTMRPLTMCSPPANRTIEETSDFRQQAFVTCVLASSAFTCAVIAMRPILPRIYLPRTFNDDREAPCSIGNPATLCLRQEPRISIGQLGRIMSRRPVVGGEIGHHQLRPEGPGDALQA